MGEVGNSDFVGGLVGTQGSGGTITSSYATGSPDGGEGNSDNPWAAWWGTQGSDGTITSSYGFGTTANGNSNTHGASTQWCRLS